jgi:hypothetical protein
MQPGHPFSIFRPRKLGAYAMALPAIFVGSLALTPPASAATALVPGIYNIHLVPTTTKITKGSGVCSFTVGDSYNFVLEYPGATKPGGVLRLENDGTNIAAEVVVDLPKAPANGAPWKGTYSATVEPNHAFHWAGEFTQTLNVIDTHSFAGQMTLGNFSDPDGSYCTVTFNDTAVLSGIP